MVLILPGGPTVLPCNGLTYQDTLLATVPLAQPILTESDPRGGSWRRRLAARISTHQASVAVVGLGYVGLPLLLNVRRAGFDTIGIDADRRRVEELELGRSYVTDVPDDVLREALPTLRLRTDYEGLRNGDVVVVCVPTPLTDNQPDLSCVRDAAHRIAQHLRPGSLVILESTTYPGTTEDVFAPILETSGLIAGRDFALAYSPERIDPGRDLEHMVHTPKVVGGLTPGCAGLTARFYQSFVNRVHTVSSPRQAEMAKLIENTFRYVNIALVNDLAMISGDLGVDIWEALDAAATKPFGFMPFWPGPGVGGHCIAVDPSYLSWRVGQQSGHPVHFIEYAQQVNARMPRYVVHRVGQSLNSHGKSLKGSRVLGLGVTYKADVNDCRESPALTVLAGLAEAGAHISYHDPYVQQLQLGMRTYRSVELSEATLAKQDCVLVLTAHSSIDFARVVKASNLVFDSRGVTRGLRDRKVVRL